MDGLRELEKRFSLLVDLSLSALCLAGDVESVYTWKGLLDVIGEGPLTCCNHASGSIYPSLIMLRCFSSGSTPREHIARCEAAELLTGVLNLTLHSS